MTVSGVEQFPGELDGLRADNARLRRLLQLSEEQARAAASDQANELTPVIASALKKRAPGYLKMGFPDPRAQMR